ncbi:MAG TPA: YciI family protein [Burkholderiales bacterium]|nr:YciI family protein [Burkholderiales bacterium]
MFYAIIGEDVADSLSRRMAVRAAHLKRIEALVQAGRLLLAGSFPAIDSPEPGPAGMSGSLIVAEFDSLEAARAWIEADPYVTEGVFAAVVVKPFCRIFPE